MNNFPYIPVFWDGTHQNKGPKKIWDASDVKRIVTATAARGGEIPFTVDHPENDLPVFGKSTSENVRLVERNGKTIIEVRPTEFSTEYLADIKKSGRNKVSVKLRKDGSIQHIGLVENPAVVDLPPLAFSQNEGDAGEYLEAEFSAEGVEYSFADWRMPRVYTVLQTLREWFIGKHGLEEANKAIPGDFSILSSYEPEVPTYITERIDKLEDAMQGKQVSNQYFSQDQDIPMTPEELAAQKAENEQLKARTAKAEADAVAAKAEADAERKKNEELQRQNRTQEFSAYLDKPGITSKVIPAKRPELLHLMHEVADSEQYEFSVDGKTEKASAMDTVKFLIENQKDAVSFGRTGDGVNAVSDDDDDEITQAAKAYNESRGH